MQHRFESTEVGGHEVDRCTRISEEPFRGAEEAAAIVDPCAGEQLIEVGQQRAEDVELFEVVTLAERVQKPAGHTRTEWYRKRVDRTHGSDRGTHLHEHADMVQR